MTNDRNEEQAIRVLRTPDTNMDFHQHIAYDLRGEDLRKNFREEISIMYKCTL